MYICKYCGKEFNTQQGYASHVGKCKMNPNRIDVNSLMKKARDGHDKTTTYKCKYCGKTCVGKNSLVQHEIRCKNNPDRITISKDGKPFISNFIKYNEDCREGTRHHPFFGKNKQNCEPLKKGVETRKLKYQNGELCGTFYKKTHSDETKERMRISAMSYLKNTKNIKSPRYNINSISYIEELNVKYNWNLQHAENGGEVEICGFYVDGYDKKLNIVFEYDEPSHYIDVENSILSDRDLKRQEIIIKETGCDFYRYNEYLHLLYKI